MDLGKRLKKLRQQANLSAKELSIMSGVTRSLISELETGKRQSTSTDTIAKLAQALKVSPEYFFDTQNQSSPELHRQLPRDILRFLQQDDSQAYIRIAQRARDLGLPPEFLEEWLNLLERHFGNLIAKTDKLLLAESSISIRNTPPE